MNSRFPIFFFKTEFSFCTGKKKSKNYRRNYIPQHEHRYRRDLCKCNFRDDIQTSPYGSRNNKKEIFQLSLTDRLLQYVLLNNQHVPKYSNGIYINTYIWRYC